MGLLDIYNTLIYDYGDSRIKDWMFVTTPVPLILISLSYLYFVLKCGPRFMEKRPPYQLRAFTKYYNVFQIVANAAFIYGAFRANWFRDYGFICRVTGFGTDYQSMEFLRLIYYLLLLKVADYVETVVFVLRKKQKQISFLHLYHHVSTVLLCWICLKYFAVGTTLLIMIVNSAVHVIMYTYYYLSTFGPSVRQRIQPFKKMVTIIQLVQFVFLFIVTAQGYFSYCNIGLVLILFIQADLILNMVLFTNFYIKTYVKPKRK